MNKINSKTVRTYTYYSDKRPSDKIVVITIEETLLESSGHIEIIDMDNAPIDVILIEKYNNSYSGALSCLEDRAMPPNRCFFADYCKEHGYNPYDINDRLKISKGRNCDDDIFVTIEEQVIDG